jgi:hypothetical protein
MKKTTSRKKRYLDDECDDNLRRSRLRAMGDKDVDFKKFRSALKDMRKTLKAMGGSNQRRTGIIRAIEGMLALTECPQTMILPL